MIKRTSKPGAVPIPITSQFQYWALVLELELLALQFIHSLWEAHFTLYVPCLAQLVPWMFSLDHTNYARCLPVRIKDMVPHHQVVLSVHAQFEHGNFVLSQSSPDLNQSLSQLVHVLHFFLVDSILHHSPNLLIYWVEI